MILDLQSAPGYLTRDGAFFDPRLSWTIASWYRAQASTPSSAFREFFYQGGTAYVSLCSHTNTNDLLLRVNDGSTSYDSASAALTLGTPVYVAATYNASTHVLTFYANGALIGTVSKDLSAWDFITGGTDQFVLSDQWGDHAVERLRIWQRCLSQQELHAESLVPAARSTTALLADNSLVSTLDLTDSSGHGRTFTTAGGTLGAVIGQLTSCGGHVLAPTGSISVAIHNHLPFGVSGSYLTPGHWGFGYYFTTGSLGFPLPQRTETVILARLTVTLADCGSLGDSVLVDISGTTPGDIDPYIYDCHLVLINLDTNEEAGFSNWPGSSDGIIPPDMCGSGTPSRPGQPYGSWSFTDFSPTPVPPFVPLVILNNTVRPVDVTIQPSGPNPGDSLCGAETPLFYAELQTDSGPVSWSWVDQPINEPTIQRQPRIVNISKLRRELSDSNGRLVINGGSITLTDYDGVIRAMIVSGAIIRQQIDIYGIDYPNLKAGGIPFRVGQYLVTQYTLGADMTVQLTFEDRFGGDSLRDLLTKPLPFRKLDLSFNPGLPIALVGKGEPLPFGLLSDEASDFPTVQVWYTGDRAIGGQTWYEGLIAGCATGGPISAWGWDGSSLMADGATHRQVKLPTSLYDTAIAMPGLGTLWSLFSSTPYRVINGRRYTVMYFLSGTPVGEDFKAFSTGQTIPASTPPAAVTLGVQGVPVHVNLRGIEDVGDSTGTVITSLPQQWQHLIAQFVEQNHATDANWYALPLTTNTAPYPVIDTDSVDLVRQQSIARIAGGYLGAHVIGFDLSRGPLGDVLQRICLGGDFDMGIDRHGRAFISMEDATLNPVANFTIIDVLQDTYQSGRDWSTVMNSLTYSTFKNLMQTNSSVTLRPSAPQQPANWLTADRPFADNPSIATLGGDPAGRRELVYEDWVTRDVSLIQPDNVAAHKLNRLSRGLIPHQLETDLCGLDVELGNNFTITHFAGLVPTVRTARCTAIELEPPDPFTRNWAVRIFGYEVSPSAQPAVVTLVVHGGGPGGVFAVGAEVAFSADPPPLGQRFLAWAGGTVTSQTSDSTIVMPAHNVILTAVFTNLSAGTLSAAAGVAVAFVGSSTADHGTLTGTVSVGVAFVGASQLGFESSAGVSVAFVGSAKAAGQLTGYVGVTASFSAGTTGRLTASAGVSVAFTSSVAPGHLNVAWDANATIDSVLGYVIEWGTSPGIYTSSRDAGNVLAYAITGLIAGTTYYVSIEAYNAGGYSPNAPEVSGVATS